MNAITTPLANLPLNITYIMDGTIALHPSRQFAAIIDNDVKLDMTGFTVGEESYDYNVAIDYKKDANLLKWLQSLNLQMPSFQQQGFPSGFSYGF